MRPKRLRASDRVAGALWGLIITGAAVTSMYTLSGYTVDAQLMLIIGLIVVGGWLLVSALLSIRPRRTTDALAGATPADPQSTDEIGLDA